MHLPRGFGRGVLGPSKTPFGNIVAASSLPYVLIQLALVYMLRVSNLGPDEFEDGAGNHIQFLSIHAPRDFNNPFRVHHPHSD